jgi:hypothetical protein
MSTKEETMNRSTIRVPLVGAVALALVAALAAAALALAPAASPASQAYGPDTCLNGFVWREAAPWDHVCVVPGVRTQAAADNARAAARRSPTGGAYGPDTCLSPYVWREAFANDHVCVETWVREQTRRDNLDAGSRRDEVRTWITAYRSQTRTCSGDVCRITSDDVARYRVNVDRLNVGRARVVLVDARTGRGIQAWSRQVAPHAFAPGGFLAVDTGRPQCAGRPNVQPNGYFVVQDLVSGIWSSRKYVWICATY